MTPEPVTADPITFETVTRALTAEVGNANLADLAAQRYRLVSDPTRTSGARWMALGAYDALADAIAVIIGHGVDGYAVQRAISKHVAMGGGR